MLNNTDLEKKINSELNTKVSSSKIVHETLNVSIEKDDLKEDLLFLKSIPDMKFKQLIDITAVDYPNKKNRFKMFIRQSLYYTLYKIKRLAMHNDASR